MSEEAEAPAGVAANASVRQLFRNVATSYVSLVVSLVLSLLLTPIVLRSLGASRYGLWVAILSIGTYLSILDTGVSTATVKEVAHCTAVGDQKRLGEVLASARLFYFTTGVIAVVIGAILVPFINDIFHPGSNLETAKVCLILLGVMTGLQLVTNLPQAALFGSGRNDRSGLFGTALSVVVTGAQILVVLLGGGLLGLFVVAAAGAFAGYVGTDIVARRTGVLPRKYGKSARPVFTRLLRDGVLNAVIALSGYISFSVDVLVIGVILPVRDVAPYSIALSTANLSRSVATTGTSLLLPTYAHNASIDARERQFGMYSGAVLVSLALCIPVTISLVCFGPGLLTLWLHKVPGHTYEVMIALNAVMLFQMPGTQSFLLLIGLGKTPLLCRLAIPAALINLGLSIPFTFWLGSVGPAIGSLPQVMTLEFVILPLVCCRELGVPMRRYWEKAWLPLVPGTVAAIALGVLLLLTVGSHGVVAAPLESVAVTLFSWIIFGVVFLRAQPALAQRLQSRLPGRLRR